MKQTRCLANWLPILSIVAVSLLVACANFSNRNHVSEIPTHDCPELHGKDTLRIIRSIFPLNEGEQTISEYQRETNFLVVGTLHTDCSACILMLQNWEDLIENRIDPTIPVILITTGNSKGIIQYRIKHAGYTHPVFVDLHDDFNNVNGLAPTTACNSFLIDRNGQLLLAGNIEDSRWISTLNRKLMALRKAE